MSDPKFAGAAISCETVDFTFDQLPALADMVLAQATNTREGLHGPGHWQRVAEIGVRLCAQTPAADPVVVCLFALLHDTERWDDGADPLHGPRAAVRVRTLHGEGALGITDAQAALLASACDGHTRERTSEDPTIGVCFDSDRLTLWRVGIRPDAQFLSSAAARGGDGWLTLGRDLEDADPLGWEQLADAFACGELPGGRPVPVPAPAKDRMLTDFQELLGREEPLHADLVPWVVADGRLGIPRIAHPLLIEPLYTPQLNAMCNFRYEHTLTLVREARARRQWAKFVVLHEKPYRLDALLQIADQLDDHAYWDLIGDVWTGSENIWQNYEAWCDLLLDDRPGQEQMMNADEREALAGQADTITVFRGFHRDGGEEGLSWTLDQDKARWFAGRLCPDPREMAPRVASGTVPRESVIAYFSRRGEQEIVVFPEDLRDVEIREIYPSA